MWFMLSPVLNQYLSLAQFVEGSIVLIFATLLGNLLPLVYTVSSTLMLTWFLQHLFI